MIGPVSGTGRAMMASLQQAIQKGMPPDQAIQYVKGMATQGVAPLTDLYAMMNQFQRLKQQPVQAPQTPPTIRDQLNMAEQQQAQQQMAMQQGLGGLPAPAMEQAQFAGGGIVAFDEGGDVNSSIRDFFIKQKAVEFVKKGQAKEAVSLLRSEGIDPHEVLGDRADILVPAPARTPVDERTRNFNLPANFGLEGAGFNESVVKPEPFGITLPSSGNVETSAAPPSDSRGGIGSSVPAAPRVAAGRDETPKVKSIEGYEQELVDLYAKRGIGKATDEYRKYLQEERDSLKEQGRVDTSLALAKAGFRMMASTSPFAAVAIGEGGQEFASQMMAIRKDQQANNRSMREAQFRLAQADEAQAAGRIKEAMSMRSDAEKQLRDTMQHKESMQFRYAQLASEERRSRATLDMQRAVLAAQEDKDVRRAQVTLATAKQQALKALGDDTNYTMLQANLQKARDEGDKDAIKKAERAVQNYRDSYLAPIESVMGGGDAGATSSVVDWADLFGG